MNEFSKELNLAMQEICLASDKYRELKTHFDRSYAHFIASQKVSENVSPSQKIILVKTEAAYAELSKAIEQLEAAFKSELICRMVYTAINKK
jgi:hypothetical protein